MAFCGKCGAQHDGKAFCPSCGAPQQAAPNNQQAAPNNQQAPNYQQTQQNNGQSFQDKISGLNNTPDTTASFDKTDIEQNKVFAILAYIGILVLVPILAAPNSKFAKFHANQGIVLAVAGFVLFIFKIVISVITDGYGVFYGLFNTAFYLLSLAPTVLAVIGIINAINGRAKELPLIGGFKILK